MSTLAQLIKNKRSKKQKKYKTPALNGRPQRKGICRKITIVTPKKPNSAIRKIAVVYIFQRLRLREASRKVRCYRPGENNMLAMYAPVLIRGGRVKDIPGMRYKIICNKYGAPPIYQRRQARSKYGVKTFKHVG